MSVKQIVDGLLQHGRQLLQQPPQIVQFTGDLEADTLVNDLNSRPHAFVIGCLMDRQIPYQRAWRIPLELERRLGGFDFPFLANLPLAQIESAMTTLHRFPKTMSEYLHAAIARIHKSYQGDAAKIWNYTPSSFEVVLRFLKFEGIGQKIASMAANILAREFKVPMADYSAIDISPDRHVQRVFKRLELIPSNASIDYLIYRARQLSPDFPGLLDFPAFEIGTRWCKPNNPLCADCYMKDLCPSVIP